MSNSFPTFQRRRFYLDNAKTREKIDMPGSYIFVVAASSIAATINVAPQEELNDGGYFEFKKTAELKCALFSHIYVNWEAQAGEWIELGIISAPDIGDYYYKPAQNFNIDEIANPVAIKNVAGENLATDVAKIGGYELDGTKMFSVGSTIAMRVYDSSIASRMAIDEYSDGINASLTNLNGSSYASQTSAGTNTFISAAANTNGVLIKRAFLNGVSYYSYGRIEYYQGGVWRPIMASNYNGGTILAIDQKVENYLIPAGCDIRIVISGSDLDAYVLYEVL